MSRGGSQSTTFTAMRPATHSTHPVLRSLTDEQWQRNVQLGAAQSLLKPSRLTAVRHPASGGKCE